MIDRIARGQLATAVRQFAIGAITNRQFEASVPASSQVEGQVLGFNIHDPQTEKRSRVPLRETVAGEYRPNGGRLGGPNVDGPRKTSVLTPPHE